VSVCAWLRFRGDKIIPYPTGRILTGLFPGTSCQATIILSLRDRKASDFQQSARGEALAVAAIDRRE